MHNQVYYIYINIKTKPVIPLNTEFINTFS